MKKETFNRWELWCTFIFLITTTLFTTSCIDEYDDFWGPKSKTGNVFPGYTEGEAYYYKGVVNVVNNDSIEIIIPEGWNGSFLVYAHGYVDPVLPIALPNDLVEGIPLKTLLTSPPLNFAYASTSFRENGFTVKEAISDITFLGTIVKASFKPDNIYLGGVSEGGLVALKTLEKKQNVFDAGLVTCAPIGHFQQQLQYFGDFHLIFKKLYEVELSGMGIDIGSPKYVSPVLMQAWTEGNLKIVLAGILGSSRDKLETLLQAAHVPVNVESLPTEALTGIAMEILRFNIMATNDMIDRVYGVPYDNMTTEYPGIPDIERIEGDKLALLKIKLQYETKGTPHVPVVLMHTTGDHVTPAWHIEKYLEKVYLNGMADNVEYILVKNYGHCNFTKEEILSGISMMVN
jgi:pimeloyl-ACP methyl ester carboxylesterase